MANVIVSCGCGNTDQFAKDAYNLLFPRHPLPPIVSSLYAYNQIKGVPKSGKEYELAHAALVSDGKYAYYFGDGQVYDLLKGVRIA